MKIINDYSELIENEIARFDDELLVDIELKN